MMHQVLETKKYKNRDKKYLKMYQNKNFYRRQYIYARYWDVMHRNV